MTTPNLPRVQEGSSPQHLIMTLFGDYWYGREEHLPSSGIVAVASEFGVSEASTRIALSRLARRGLLTSSKEGRRTFYGVDPDAREILEANRDRSVAFLSSQDTEWDGTWSVVAFSVPQSKHELRHALRTRLRGLGFGALYDGLWVSPRTLPASELDELTSLGIEQVTVFTATVASPDPDAARHLTTAWNLDSVRGAYENFLTRFGPLIKRVRAGDVGASEALVSRTAVMDTWREFRVLDPDLPAALLPVDWPRDRARDLYVDVYEALGPLAELRFQQLMAEHSAELAKLVTYHSAYTLTAR